MKRKKLIWIVFVGLMIGVTIYPFKGFWMILVTLLISFLYDLFLKKKSLITAVLILVGIAFGVIINKIIDINLSSHSVIELQYGIDFILTGLAALIGVGLSQVILFFIKNNKKRPRKRYYAGVCAALGSNYKFAPILIRILFLVTTFLLFSISFFAIFPLLVYLILCFRIPNYQNINKKIKIKYGLLSGFSFLLIITTVLYLGNVFTGIQEMLNDKTFIQFFYGGVEQFQKIILSVIILFSIILFVLGYVIGRSIAERKEFEIIPVPNKEI